VITAFDPVALADGIASVIDNPALAATLSSNLQKENLGTAGEIGKLYAAIGHV
jgi:hypothetical protein